MPLLYETTVMIPVWPLRTEAEVDVAAHELLHDYGINNEVRRFKDEFGRLVAQLVVNQPSGPLIVEEGSNLIVNPTGVAEFLSNDQLAARGLPVPEPLDPTPSS